MQVNNYKIVKHFIKQKLQEIESPLSSSKIGEEVENLKMVFNDKRNKNIVSQILSLSNDVKFDEEEWLRMTKELEMHFDVKMDEGFLIQGDEQQSRNNNWWTDKVKLFQDHLFWDRYKEYIGRDFSPEVIRTIDTDTDVVMNNIEDPIADSFTRYGMVVGHVQSGKTANYSALICKACDAGYKFIIVIAGGINNLRNQTQVRINEAVIGRQGSEQVGVGKLGKIGNSVRPCSLTTAESDFNKRDADRNKQMFNFDNISVPVIMVIKKNTRTLDNVIEWLKALYKNKISKHAMLLIDDESDYASINTKVEDNPSTINKKLRKLMGLFEKSAYVAYTATPYANIFIDHKVNNGELGQDLFPKDFIVALNAPDNYFGARKIFLDYPESFIVKNEDHEGKLPLKHKKNLKIDGLPESLYEAIRLFVINIAIRNLRGQSGSHNSMLVHVSRYTAIHKKVAFFVENYLDCIRNEILAYGAMPNPSVCSKIIKDMEDTFRTRYKKIEYKWFEVLKTICEIVNSIMVREVHQQSKIPLEYSRKAVTNAIVVGGTSLSRGFTLEGLSVSYFIRTTAMYDTLMQMGRWFGYRNNYEDLCRIYMTDQMADNFADIIEATEDLFDDFKRMAEAKKTPSDFGLSVRQYPNSALQVTAKNKLQHTQDYYFEMRLDGLEKETTWLSKDEEILENNLISIKDLIKKLNNFYSHTHELKKNKNIWKDVNRQLVIDFLNSFQVYTNNPFYITSKMPIDFIKQYASDIDIKWDIVLAAGSGKKSSQIDGIQIYKEIRKITDKSDYYEINKRQISSESIEQIVFTKEELKELGSKKRKDLRANMKKPLLVLHIIESKYLDEHNENKILVDNLAAFGISFPGGVNSGSKVIRHKINSVYVQQIIKDMSEESDYDD